MEFEVADESKFPGCTKRTRHWATCLRGDTECVSSRFVSHDDGFDHLVVVRLEEEFGCLSFRIRYFMMECQGSVGAIFSKKCTNVLWKCIHRFKIRDEILVEGILDLSVTKSLVAVRHKEFFYFLFVMNRKHWFLEEE